MDLSNLSAIIFFALLVLLFMVEFGGIFLLRYAKKYRWAVTFYTGKIMLAGSSSDYISRSFAYLRLKQYELAIQDCDKALARKADAPMAYNNRGAAYFGLKQYREALQDFNRALALKSDFAPAFYSRGTLYSETEEYQLALHDYDRAIALRPKASNFYFNRGVVFIRLKEYERALQDFEQALVLDPTDYAGYHNRGYVSLHLNSFEQGSADLLKAWKLHPYVRQGLMIEFCNMCVEKPDLATAERLEKLAFLDTDPDTDTAYLASVCRGVALWLRERYEEALIELEHALLLKPDSQDAYFWVGMTCASLGRDEEAKQALEHALALGLPRVLLAPLKLLQKQQPAFFDLYANARDS